MVHIVALFHAGGTGSQRLLQELGQTGRFVVPHNEDVVGMVEVGLQQCLVVGDEYLHYNTTEDDYSLVRRDDGSYVYASLDDDGQLIPTTLVAHDAGERT